MASRLWRLARKPASVGCGLWSDSKQGDPSQWQRDNEEYGHQVAAAKRTYDAAIAKADATHQEALAAWESRREAYQAQQVEENLAVDTRYNAYLAKDPQAVVGYTNEVPFESLYPDFFNHFFDIDYGSDTQTLLVEFQLPAPDALPTLKAVKYVASRDDFHESHISEAHLL